MKPKCKKKGGTLAEACRAIFACVVPGTPNNWFVEECKVCGQWHIIGEPKSV